MINVNPNFISGYLNPKEAPKPPGPAPVDNQVAQSLMQFGDYLTKLKNDRIAERMKEFEVTKLQGDIDVLPFTMKQKAADASKAIVDAENTKSKADAAKALMEGQVTPGAAPVSEEIPRAEIPETPDIPVSSPDYKFNVDSAIANDKTYKEAVDMIKATTLPMQDFKGYREGLQKATKEAKEHAIISELNRQVDLVKPKTREEVYGIYKKISKGNTEIDRNELTAILNKYDSESDIAKAEADAKRLSISEENAKLAQDREARMAEAMIKNEERLAKALERQEKLDKTRNENEFRREIQTQVKDLGKEIRENQYVPLVSSVKKVRAALADYAELDAKGSNHMDALKGLFARSENVSLQTALLNGAMGVNPSDEKTKEAMRKLDMPAVKEVLKNKKFQTFFSSLADLINRDLKRTSGTAVTASELAAFLNKFGLSAYSPDSGTFREAIEKYANDLGEELQVLESSYDEKAIKEYNRRGEKMGLSFPRLDITDKRNEIPNMSDVDADLDSMRGN